MLKLCYDVEGAIFGYQHNDEICLLLRNNQHHETTPWFDNKLQKICSVSSSIASVHFNNCANTIDLDLLGDPIFTSQVFVVPDLTEATNTMIYKQQHNAYASVNLACFYELIKKYDKDTIKKMINGMNLDDRIELLNQECGIDFNDYPAVLRRGSACYKAPKITTDGVRNKWIINNNLPIFAKDQNFLNQIFRNGTDIVRTETVNGLLQNNLP
jgi:tRNA(His) 5'-end guanylyltransferase